MGKVSVRYIVHNVDEAIPFYTDLLGFELIMHPAPPFAILNRGDLRLLLSSPGTRGGGGQTLEDGSMPAPGGWNRFHLEVEDLKSVVAKLKQKGAHFRSEVVEGVAGQQIILDDPSGNPIELFEYYDSSQQLIFQQPTNCHLRINFQKPIAIHSGNYVSLRL